MLSYALIFGLSYLAFSLSAICGGGAGILLIPVIGKWVPVHMVPAALSIGTFSNSASRLILFKEHIRWQMVRYFVPAALPAVFAGAFLLKYINPLYLELVMGVFLLSNFPLLFKREEVLLKAETVSRTKLILIGLSAGFLSGITGAVGLLFNKFYLRHGLTKEEIMATRAANEILMHIIKLILYAALGLISSQIVFIGFLIASAALLSAFSIKYVLPLLSEIIFKKIGYAAMVISGTFMLVQTSADIMTASQGKIQSKVVARGIETTIQWQHANYALEFKYDEGFEFEQVIPFNNLNSDQKQLVLKNKGEATRLVIEEVYTMKGRSYEAYFFKENSLLLKFEFN